jgi:Uncharacterized ACR, COG1678
MEDCMVLTTTRLSRIQRQRHYALLHHGRHNNNNNNNNNNRTARLLRLLFLWWCSGCCCSVWLFPLAPKFGGGGVVVALVQAWSLSPRCCGGTKNRVWLHPAFQSCLVRKRNPLFASFDKDEDDDDDDEDDEDDDDDEGPEESLQDLAKVAEFRARMTNLFGDGATTTTASTELVGGYSSSSSSSTASAAATSTTQPQQPWAIVTAEVKPGCVLVANPAAFLSDYGGTSTMIRPNLLAKFGLQQSPPRELGPDRRADLLPVLLIVEQMDGITRAVLLNRRTGYLLGDLGPLSSSSSSSSEEEEEDGTTNNNNNNNSPLPILEKFCIQPLWFGGVDSVGSSSTSSSALEMLHQCPYVDGAVQITKDGLYWGGNPVQAQDALTMTSSSSDNNRIYTGFDFKFFLQSTVYPAPILQQELAAGTFFAVSVSKEVLFQSRDRMGSRRAKPLWTEIMELLGGDYATIKRTLYEEENDSDGAESSYL